MALGYGAIGQNTIGQIGTAAGAEIVTSDKWFRPLSEPVRFPPGLTAGQQQFLTAANLLPLVSFSWFEQLSEPVRKPAALPAGQQQFLAFQPAPSPFVATGWFNWLSEPPRFKPGLPAPQQQFLALNPQPFVSFSWFNELSRPPKLTRPAVPAALQPFLAFEPLPRVSFGWFGPLSEPPRFKPGLTAALQQFYAGDTAAIPISKLIAWFQALSEPPRFKSGLRASLQQFLATPSQLRPTPTTFLQLDATETKDTFLGAISTFNRPTTGEVGVIEVSFTGAEIGAVTVKPSVGTSGVVTDPVVGSGGAPVATIGRAGISIRIL